MGSCLLVFSFLFLGKGLLNVMLRMMHEVCMTLTKNKDINESKSLEKNESKSLEKKSLKQKAPLHEQSIARHSH